MAFNLMLTYMGGSEFRTRYSQDQKRAEEKLDPGARVKASITQPRSIKQNGLFYVWLDKVWSNIPETCEHQFRDADHLKHWLLYRIGCCRVDHIPLELFNAPGFIPFLKRSKGDVWFEVHSDIVWIFEPDSTSFFKMDGDRFSSVFNKCQEIVSIDLLPGVSMKELIGSLQDTE